MRKLLRHQSSISMLQHCRLYPITAVLPGNVLCSAVAVSLLSVFLSGTYVSEPAISFNPAET